ncbi:ATP-binding SpoIIE family protein phosphatase [Acidobacterium sp. S8]|uniref:ATP-binding SpoIIE family protein phosphatase n=1 Tax=Acidobacterium sp. S8 TaxID=1641854 RepID=UPI0020B13548|nr:ATP-binding SpoIIE family protein phosphatase [Acidobacterium sp. S8]
MPVNRAIPISAGDPSQVGNARRQAISLAAALEFDETRQGQTGIIATEAARNIAAHGDSGEIILSPWSIHGSVGLDIFALDQGKGIPNIEMAVEDGYSTAGTAGQGLGAISRLAGEFQIFSAAGRGTALFARVYRTATDQSAISHLSFGAISVPIAGERVNGDAWSAQHTTDRSIYIVADGLGHGPLASEAAEEAIKIFHLTADRHPELILKDIHSALTKTRGAAVSIAEIRYNEGVLNFAGAGNVAGAVLSRGKARNMVSMNGTVGHSVAKIQSFSYTWEPNSFLLMLSDGIGTRWNVEQYPGLAQRHPALIAAILYRDFSRRRDDATIIVSRIQ